MDRAWESQAKTAQVRLGAASGLTVSAQIPVDGAVTAPRTPQTPPRSPNELASKSPFPPRTLRLLRSSEAKSKGLHLLTMRARAPAGRSVPEGHGASAELSRAPGICALLATPERTQHSLRPPPQVTGACSSFHPCPPPGAHSPPSPSPRGLSGAGGCLSSPRVQARSPRRRDTKPCLCFRNQKYATCRWWHRGPAAHRPRGCAGLDGAATARQLP